MGSKCLQMELPNHPKSLKNHWFFKVFVVFVNFQKCRSKIAQRSQDASQNAPKLTILGARLANIAPSWCQLGAHLRSSWALRRHLGPTWVHFGSLLALLLQHCGPRCRQDLQNHPQTLIFNDFGTDFGPFLKHFSIRVL